MKVKEISLGKYTYYLHIPPPSMYYPLPLTACLRACKDGLQVVAPHKKIPPVSLAAGHQNGVGCLTLRLSRGKQSAEVHLDPTECQ